MKLNTLDSLETITNVIVIKNEPYVVHGGS